MTEPDSEPLELVVGRKVLERFRKWNADRRAQGDRLREAIRNLKEAHSGPVPLSAEAILAQLPSARELGRDHPPSLRTVLRHLQALIG